MRKLRLEELGRPSRSQYAEIAKLPITVVLDNIRSGMNVGSIFRTSDAFKIEEVILTGITAQPPHKEILKTAIGASRSVPWKYEEDIGHALSTLKANHYQLVGIEQTTASIPLQEAQVNTSQKYAIILGNEVDGISEEALPLLDLAVEIPQFGTKHSLNVSVCGGIILWHFAQPYLTSNFK